MKTAIVKTMIDNRSKHHGLKLEIILKYKCSNPVIKYYNVSTRPDQYQQSKPRMFYLAPVLKPYTYGWQHILVHCAITYLEVIASFNLKLITLNRRGSTRSAAWVARPHGSILQADLAFLRSQRYPCRWAPQRTDREKQP